MNRAVCSLLILAALVACPSGQEEHPAPTAKTSTPAPKVATRKVASSSLVEIEGHGGTFELHVGVTAWLPVSTDTPELVLARKHGQRNLSAMLIPKVSPKHRLAQQSGRVLVAGIVAFGDDASELDSLVRRMKGGPATARWNVRAFGVSIELPRGFVLGVTEDPAWQLQAWGSAHEDAIIKLMPALFQKNAPSLNGLLQPGQKPARSGRTAKADWMELEIARLGAPWRRRFYMQDHGQFTYTLLVQAPVKAFADHVKATDRIVTSWQLLP